MKLSPRALATIVRGAKVVACEAAAAALVALLNFIATGQTGLDASMTALIVAIATPAFAAAEKWLHWFEAEPVTPAPAP